MKFVKSELTNDMKLFVDSVCRSLIDQHARGHDYKEAANMIAKKFLKSNAPKSAFNKLNQAIQEYMIDAGYTTASMLNSGYVDNNGVEIVTIDEAVPKELADRRYGCIIDFNNSPYTDEAIEMLIDSGFIGVSAYKLQEHGVLSPSKKAFFAHPQMDCDEWADEIVSDYPQIKVGRSFHINWSNYYDIEIDTEKSTKLLKYHQLSK